MPAVSPIGATVSGATHHLDDINGVPLHYVTAGESGTPFLLVHGWPETWYAFHRLIPLLAERHRVVAVDLRGFGDSGTDAATYDEATMAEDLHQLIEQLGIGPVHVLCQDISGGVTFRLATTRPDDVLSFTGIETTLAGHGLEMLADVLHGGSWHVSVLGTPGIPSMLLPGHERELIAGWAYPMMTGPNGGISSSTVDEIVRAYSREDAWRGTEGIYRQLFVDDGETRARAEAHPLRVPVLAVDGINHPFTESTLRQVAAGDFTSVTIDGVGHLVAQESPERLAEVLLSFAGTVDGAR
ncbi:alpha/beta fold hydrolase [Aeromicrobium chenweiae]|uniref:Alpha/beta hydrolase n=1 Tax=Aeromicrobium chenweiae TaxID=2079793 RepID=A0A2S0WLS9_9ACTN|nr:alpha/beta hydrolase [Aeromicrobium chenweiae]AWB92298.1 alpha/beta hydrolase [Aeromicrobium chenweiae]TGN31418.1 alpha/beta hydrolase [Aeromicrobium chenweiae]